MNFLDFLLANGMFLMLWPLVPLSLFALGVAVSKLLNLSNKDLGDFIKNMGYAATYGGAAMLFAAIYKAITGVFGAVLFGGIGAVFLLALGLYLVVAGVNLSNED